jgi:hypothetical protein
MKLTHFKAGHFTLDNAANNYTMMKAIESELAARDIPFDAADRHIMCYAHVVNLSSGRVIRNITGSDEDDSSDESNATVSNPVTLARAVVRAIRLSGQRRVAFEELITDGNAKGWFKAGQPPRIVKLQPLQLLRDVPTRWDSVYHMLNRLRMMRPVCYSSYVIKFNCC